MADEKELTPEELQAEREAAKTLFTDALMSHHETIRKYGVLIPILDGATVQDRLDSIVEKYK